MSNRQARVIAPYATVKILDQMTGKHAVRGFYRDAVLPADADPDAVATLVRREYAEWVDQPEPVLPPAPEPPVEPVVAGARPKDYAPKPEWVEYAVTRRAEGVSEDDARAEAEGKSKADLIAEHGN